MNQGMQRIEVGSVLSRPKGFVMHRGIYMGNGWVFENSWTHGERLTTFAEFAARGRVRVERVLKISVAEIYRRVKESLGRPYSLFNNNCDHAISRVADGYPRSAQLLGWTIAAFATACVLSFAPPAKR